MWRPDSYRFPGLSGVSAEQHAATALALLPALLLLARPAEGSGAPHAALVGASKLFVWALRELQAMANEGDPAGVHERLLPLTVRVCRAELEAAEAGAVHAAQWRSTQPRRAGSAEADSGALSHLRQALQWTYAVSQWVLRHAHAIQVRSLAAESSSRGPRGLVRSVPQLSLQGERVASRLHRLARTHGLDALEEPDVLTKSSWEDSLREAERTFRQQHDNALLASAAPRADSWQALDARDGDAPAMALSASLLSGETLREGAGGGEEQGLPAESSDGYAYFATGGFGDEGAAGGGWGLYKEEEEEEEEEEDEKEEDEEEDKDDDEEGWRGWGASASAKRRLKELSGRIVRPRGV